MIFFPPQSLKAIFASGIRLEFLSHKNHHCKQPKSFLKAMTEKKSLYILAGNFVCGIRLFTVIVLEMILAVSALSFQ